MTRSRAVADWETEFQRWLAPFLGCLGHKARQRWLPVYVRGQMSATCAGAVRDRARVRGGRHGGALPPPTLHETAPHLVRRGSASPPIFRTFLSRDALTIRESARRSGRTATPKGRCGTGRGRTPGPVVSMGSPVGDGLPRFVPARELLRCGVFSRVGGGSRPAIRLRLGLGKTAALPQTRQWSVLISKARRLRRTALPRSASGRGFSSSMFVSLTSLTGTRNVMRTAVAVLSAS